MLKRIATLFAFPPRVAGAHNAFLGIAALLGVGLGIFAFVVTLAGRDIFIDQSMLLLVTQQWVLGRELYVGVLDAHPPPFHLLNALPIVLSNAAGWPLVRSFNLFFSLYVVLSGVLVGLSGPPRLRLAAGGSWVAFALLAANDYMFGQREYMFMLAWVPYLLTRCGIGEPSRSVSFAAGALAGFTVCIKPHFALIVAGTEAWLWLFRRDRCRIEPLIGLLASGAAQVLLFLLLFDVHAYLDNIEGDYYYALVGMHYRDVVEALLHSPIAIGSLGCCLLALIVISPSSRLRAFVEATTATILFANLLIVLQGYFRPYYLIQLYVPAGALLFSVLWHGPDQFVGTNRNVRQALFYFGACSCLLGLWYITSDPGIGLGRLLSPVLVHHQKIQSFGGIGRDAFADYVNEHVPADKPIFVIAPTYGSERFDPIASMIRLGRPVSSHYPGMELPFMFAAMAGDSQRACAAAENMRKDIDASAADWLFVRRSMSSWAMTKADDPLAKLHECPEFWSWFVGDWSEADRFDQYSVFRRSTRNGDAGALPELTATFR